MGNEDPDPLYASLRSVLDRAHEQASRGKGKERHANDDAFEEQLIVQIGRHLGGTIDFNVGQAWKKSAEAKRLPRERAVAELLGTINYLAGAVLILERSSVAPEVPTHLIGPKGEIVRNPLSLCIGDRVRFAGDPGEGVIDTIDCADALVRVPKGGEGGRVRVRMDLLQKVTDDVPSYFVKKEAP